MSAKSYLIVLLVCFVAVACHKSASRPDLEAEKPVTDEIESQLHKVNFNFSDFEVGFQGARKAAKEMPAKDFLSYLYYSVYDSSGTFVKDITQYRWYDSTTFGKISDSLKSGKYDIVFVGAANDSVFVLNKNKLLTARLNMGFSYWPVADVFFKKFSLVVDDRDTTINSLRLNRITGNLEVRLKDSLLPADVARISIVTKNKPSLFNIIQESITGADSSYAGDFNPSFNSYPISMSSSYFGSENQLQVVIRAYDKNDALIKEKVVDGVHVYVNKKTVLSGKLFPAPSEVEIPITVDPDFAETINQTF